MKNSFADLYSFFIQVELQPTETLIPSAKRYLPNRALVNQVEEIESRFDDLRAAHHLVNKYNEHNDTESNEDIKRFSQEIDKMMKIYVDAISILNVSGEESQFDDCFVAYENALDGYDEEGKFVQFWRNVLTTTKVCFDIKSVSSASYVYIYFIVYMYLYL